MFEDDNSNNNYCNSLTNESDQESKLTTTMNHFNIQ